RNLIYVLFCLGLGFSLACTEKTEKKGEYTFTTNWFNESYEKNWEKLLAEFKGKPNVSYLEIGVFEGKSFFWLLDHILTGPSVRATAVDLFSEPYFKIFRENLKNSGHQSRVTVKKGLSE